MRKNWFKFHVKRKLVPPGTLITAGTFIRESRVRINVLKATGLAMIIAMMKRIMRNAIMMEVIAV